MDNPEKKFVADAMLGKLARWLRLLGCDVLYSASYDDSKLLAIALTENRILLTRDTELAKRAKSHGFLITSDGTKNELREVIENFNIEKKLKFTRCPECNGKVLEIDRALAKERVPEYTFLTHDIFFECSSCGKIYWSGSHRELACDDLKRITIKQDEG